MRPRTLAAFGWAVLTVMGDPVQAQDTSSAWAFTAELTAVWTAGNSESNTFGFGATVERTFSSGLLTFGGGGLQARSSLTTRRAVGDPTTFSVQEDKVTEKTAEWYFARIQYDHNISERVFLFGGADWMRNQFSGIDSRFLFAAGAGAQLGNSPRFSLKADVSGTYTFQEDVVANPFAKTNFPGIRASYVLATTLTSTTRLTSKLTGDLNVENTSDVRIDFSVGLPIAVSSVLAFKPSYQILWRNEPSLIEVPLEDAGGTPNGTVNVPLQKFDSFLRLALVFEF